MKSIFLILLAIASILNPFHAQVYDHALSFGFYSQPKTLHSLGNGRWLTLVHGEPIPGILYVDTVVAVVFNSGGEILQKIYLPLPKSEAHNINSAIPLADDGFAVSVANDLCDAGFNRNSLLAFNKDGTLRWSRQTTDTEYQPRLLKPAPDGNLIGLNYHQLAKYSAATGTVLWKIMLTPVDPSIEIYDFAFVTGVDAFVAVGFPDLQYWENWGTSDSPDYQLVNSRKILPSAYVYKVIKGAPGYFYTFDVSSGQVFLFDKWWLDYTTLTTIPYRIYDMAFAQGGDLYFTAYNSQDSLSYVLRTGQDGTALTPLSASRWQKGLAIAYHNDMIAIAGVSGSGPHWDNSLWLPPKSARHLWVQTRPLSGGSPEATVNAALAAVEQNEPLSVTIGQALPWDPQKSYQFSGGKFRVQLRNTGNTVIDQADVQIAFDWDYSSGICLELPAKQRRYTGLGLAPGESVWLDFGDIAATGQLKAPTQLCFWVAAPNERPDADRADDVYCQATVLSSNEQVFGQCSITPNPADTYCRIVLSAEKTLTAQLYDIAGCLIQEIDIPAGENTQIDLQTGNWPDGMYLLQIENRVAKIVVQHR